MEVVPQDINEPIPLYTAGKAGHDDDHHGHRWTVGHPLSGRELLVDHSIHSRHGDYVLMQIMLTLENAFSTNKQ